MHEGRLWVPLGSTAAGAHAQEEVAAGGLFDVVAEGAQPVIGVALRLPALKAHSMHHRIAIKPAHRKGSHYLRGFVGVAMHAIKGIETSAGCASL